jgi:capsular exopolysaccharide synthesis family protein
MSQFFKVLEQAERERADDVRRRQQVLPRPAPLGSVTSSTVTVAPDSPPIPPVEPVLAPIVADAHTTLDGDRHEGVEAHLVSLLYPASYLAEPYREIRHFVEQLHRNPGVSIIAISSPGLGEGKTTTAINLAGALAQAPDARVLLVEADLRQPSIARYLPLADARRGLVDAILDATLDLADVVRPLPPFNLDVLLAGRVPSAPYEIMKSPRFEDLLQAARRRYDYVVVDTTPLVPVPDARLITKCVDGILLVVAAHKTPRKQLAAALNALEPSKVLGLLFNGDDERPSRGYGYPAYGVARDERHPGPWRALVRRVWPAAAGIRRSVR